MNFSNCFVFRLPSGPRLDLDDSGSPNSANFPIIVYTFRLAGIACVYSCCHYIMGSLTLSLSTHFLADENFRFRRAREKDEMGLGSKSQASLLARELVIGVLQTMLYNVSDYVNLRVDPAAERSKPSLSRE